jgi:hypothetical protein
MTDDRLQQLLENSDAAHAPEQLRRPQADGLLAALAARRSRRTRRRTVAACGVIVLALVVWRTADHRDSAMPAVVADRSLTPPPNADAVRTRLQELDREAAMQLRVVQGLTNDEQVAHAEQPPDESFAAIEEQFTQEVARSAAISWRYALLVEQEFGDAAAARGQYERVVARFPNTPWARQAAESLRRLPATDQTQPL